MMTIGIFAVVAYLIVLVGLFAFGFLSRHRETAIGTLVLFGAIMAFTAMKDVKPQEPDDGGARINSALDSVYRGKARIIAIDGVPIEPLRQLP